MTEDELTEALTDYAIEDMVAALSLVTVVFVSLFEAYCELQGINSEKAIRISSNNGGRPITIHPEPGTLH